MRRLLAALTCLILLAGCGGGGSKTVTHPKVAPPAHACDPANYTMQCALKTVAPPVGSTGLGAGNLYGVDFAWGGPRSCSQMQQLGAKFGASYLSYDTSGKNWTRSLVDQFHGCGIGTVSVWETSANRAAQGFSAGASDAVNAKAQATGIGNTDGAISFAIDFDANGPETYNYFKGAQSVLGSRVDAYGGYRPLKYLHDHGAVGNLNWQTYAWSGGAWLPASIAPLEQYLNGNAYDNDRAIAANYGQFPAPHVGPSPATVKLWYQLRAAAFHQYRAHHCTSPQTKNPYCASSANTIKTYQSKLWTVNPKFKCFGRGALVGQAVCAVVRGEAQHYFAIRNASRKAISDANCAGPPNFPTPLKHQSKWCQVKTGQIAWAQAKGDAVVHAYS